MNSEKLMSGTMHSALAAQGQANPLAVMEAAQLLLVAVGSSATVEDLYHQKKPQFAEGSAPTADSPRGKLMDSILHAMLGLDARSTFKVAMDGFGQHAGGLIILDVDNDYNHVLVTKGDIYNKGKIGVLGGQAKDSDRGSDFSAAIRENGEEIGHFPFDPARLFHLVDTMEWREVDSRIDAYWIRAGFFVYLATSAEVLAMREGYKLHVARTGGDPEIAGLNVVKRRTVLELIRDGHMGYFDQTQAFVMTALCIPLLDKAKAALTAIGITAPEPKMLWSIARVLATPTFEQITQRTDVADWRRALDVDSFA